MRCSKHKVTPHPPLSRSPFSHRRRLCHRPPVRLRQKEYEQSCPYSFCFLAGKTCFMENTPWGFFLWSSQWAREGAANCHDTERSPIIRCSLPPSEARDVRLPVTCSKKERDAISIPFLFVSRSTCWFIQVLGVSKGTFFKKSLWWGHGVKPRAFLIKANQYNRKRQVRRRRRRRRQ